MTNELRHTPKLRLLSAFLAAAMTLTTLPAAAFAADGITSDLSVAGTSVTADNATDILGDGTAKYEGSVLTLSGEITVPQNKAGIMPIRSITIDGTGTLTGTEKTGYGIFPQADKAEIAAGADITLERFNCGTYAYGVDVSGILTIRDVNYGVSGEGATVESGGKLIIQNAENAVSGSGAKVHGTLEIDERHRHRYEFNNEFRAEFEEKGLVIAGTSPDGRLVEAVEIPGRDFHLGAQFHPEFKSRPNRAHPLFKGFIAAALKYQCAHTPTDHPVSLGE